VVPGQPEQKKFAKPINGKKKELGMVHTFVIPVTVGSIKQEDPGPGQPGKKVRFDLQKNHSRKG
jgi:hypothetical protein